MPPIRQHLRQLHCQLRKWTARYRSKKRSRRVVRCARLLTLGQIGQLCWAAQGITNDQGHRTAPSALALYPLELYVIAGSVTGLAPGLYHYEPAKHMLTLITAGDKRADFDEKAVNQEWIEKAPAIFVITGITARMESLEKVGRPFMLIETGLAAQGFLLQATALGLGSTFIGGFEAPEARTALGLNEAEEVLAVLTVGHRP
jgi:SagB-type dehydrogenase family enzyme